MPTRPEDAAAELGEHRQVASSIQATARAGAWTVDSVARVIEALSVQDIRAAFFSISEGAAAFNVGNDVFRRFVRGLGIKIIKMRGRTADGGGQGWVPKHAFMVAMLNVAGGPEPGQVFIEGPWLDKARDHRPTLKAKLDEVDRRLQRLESITGAKS